MMFHVPELLQPAIGLDPSRTSRAACCSTGMRRSLTSTAVLPVWKPLTCFAGGATASRELSVDPEQIVIRIM